MSTDSIPSSDHHHHHRRRPKSRELISRYLSSSSPNATGNPSPNASLSPVRRHHAFGFDDPTATKTKTLWPKATSSTAVSSTSSSSLGSKKIETLAEHLANLRLNDLLSDVKDVRLNPKHEFQTTESVYLTRQKSSGEISRFEQSRISTSKENYKPVIGKLKFNVNKSSSPAASGSMILPGRLSIDEKCASYNSESSATGVRKTASFSSYMSPTTVSTTRSRRNNDKATIHVSPKFIFHSATSNIHHSNENVTKTEDSPQQLHKSILKTAMRRANSLTGHGSVTSPKAKLLKSYSNLKPPTSPQKSAKGVEKLLTLGMDLFKIKKLNSTSSVLSVVTANKDDAHNLKLLHCRLMQWRFANARAQTSSHNLTLQAERSLTLVQESVVRLQHSVTQKRLKYQRESLLWKLNVILHSQMKILEAWGDIERRHTSAVSATNDSLLAAVCKIPLIDGAKVDTKLASLTLRQASDITASIKSMLTGYSPSAVETCALLSELAEVVAEENYLIEECFEMCKTISILEVQEMRLRSTMIQLAESQQPFRSAA